MEIEYTGFDNEKEFIDLVYNIDLTNKYLFYRFDKWKKNDRSKDGLLKIINYNNNKEIINVSFSGGRSSAMMLNIIRQNYNPEDYIVVFANTGKEKIETLDFVNECSIQWGIPVVWLEAKFDKYVKGGDKTKLQCIDYDIVTYETSSKNGEPFERLIDFLGYVPNRVKRLCTYYLKIHPINKFMSDNYGDEYETAMGIRYDEPKRVRKHKDDNILPLNDFKIRNEDVREFWKNQSFDLQLKDYEGNCDLCFLKGINKRRTILREHPEVADWWIGIEEKTGNLFHPKVPVKTILAQSKGTRFKMYKDFFESKGKQQTIDFDDISCFCGD